MLDLKTLVKKTVESVMSCGSFPRAASFVEHFIILQNQIEPRGNVFKDKVMLVILSNVILYTYYGMTEEHN